MAVLDQTVACRLEHVVTERMRIEPVIVLHGLRSVGKSTLLGWIAEKFGRSVLDLDDPLTRDMVSAGHGFVVQGGLCKTLILTYPRAAWPNFSNFPDTPC